MPYNMEGGDTPANTKWMEDCVSKISGTNKRTGKPYTKGEKIAICKSSYKKSHSEVGESALTKDGHPMGDFLIHEDPSAVGTWHLPVKRSGKPDHRLMGAAWAALHGGYRGNKYEGPGKAGAISKLTALYHSEGIPLPGKNASFDDVDIYEDTTAVADEESMSRMDKAMEVCMKRMMSKGKTSNEAQALCEAKLAKSDYEINIFEFILDRDSFK